MSPLGSSRGAILPPTRPGFSFVSYDPVLKSRVIVIQSGLGALTPWVITPMSGASLGLNLAVLRPTIQSSAAWTSANRAVYVPFTLAGQATVYKVFVGNGASVSGNFDIGIYSAAGTRLTSTGSTAQSGTSQLQFVDLADYSLDPESYWMALAFDNSAATVAGFETSNAVMIYAASVLHQNTAFALPATATFASAVETRVPLFGLVINSAFPG